MEFKASAFASHLAQGRVTGRLRATPQGVVFDSGDETIELPLSGLTLERGGANDSLIFLAHPDRPGWKLYTSDQRVLQAASLQDHPAAVALRRQRRRGRMLVWGVALATLLVISALPIGLILGWNSLTRLAARQVPVSWEEQLGEAAISEYSASVSLDCESEAAERLRTLAATMIQPGADRAYDYRFCIADDSSLNAFAVPGGTIVTHAGLIEAAQSADELLGVLAHELAHVDAQHGVRAIINSFGWLVALQMVLGDASGLVGMAVQAAPVLIHLQYSRGFETEADEMAVARLTDAGIDPSGLARFFERMQAQESAGGVAVPALLSTHPATEERLAALRSLERDTGQSTGNPARIQQLFSELKDLAVTEKSS